MIYYLLDITTNTVRIDHTKSPGSLNALVNRYIEKTNHEAAIVKTEPGGRLQLQRLHNRYAPYHVCSCWYRVEKGLRVSLALHMHAQKS